MAEYKGLFPDIEELYEPLTILYDSMNSRLLVTKSETLRKIHKVLERELPEMKEKIIIKELNKPFFTKLYEMCGRGYWIKSAASFIL